MKEDYGEKMKSNKIFHILIEQLRRRFVYIAGAAILLVAIMSVVANNGSTGAEENDDELFTVKSGPLTISISESGILKNKDEIILKNETERSLKIVSLVEEGTVLKEGDLIIELDSDALETNRDLLELNQKSRESDLVAAQKRREIVINQKQADIEQAEVTLRFAKLNLKKFIEGEHPKNLEAADARITMAEANLERAERDYNWSIKLHDKGFITARELKADELTAKQNRINLKISKTDLDLLVEYNDPQTIESMKSDVKQAEMALERAKLRSEADLTIQQATLYHFEIQLKDINKELKKAQARLDACRIVAPADGMVIYGTSGSQTQEGRELMEVGATVHPMHTLIRMPVSDIMLATISVQEATKPKLYENMPAVVTVDALPDQEFKGRLTKIGILPDATQSWLNPDLKVYECQVELDSASQQMKSGMNCHVEIVIEEYENTLFVPIQCVLHIDGTPTVYLKKPGGFEKRVVRTGMDNGVTIHILNGLEDGDQVKLKPPLEEAVKKHRNASTADKSTNHGAEKIAAEPEPSQESRLKDRF